jgi:hypothetical protein
MNDTEQTWAVDNRWSPGASRGLAHHPDDAAVAYAARWIDTGNGTADIVHDRQGFALREGDGTRLMDRMIWLMVDHDLRRHCPEFRDVTVVTHDVDGLVVTMRRAGGYVYVDATFTPPA